MPHRRFRPSGFLAAALAGSVALAAQNFSAPAGNRPALRRPGPSILPGGRIIAPAGQEYPTGPGAFGLALSPSGKSLATANGGPVRYSLTIMERDKDGRWAVRQLPARFGEGPDPSDAGDWRGVSIGVVFSGEHTIYAAEGNSGRVSVIDTGDGGYAGRRRAIDLNQNGFRDSYSGDLAFDPERGILYVADQANFRVAVVDVKSRLVVGSVRVGRLPFAMALSPDRHKLYVTNVGMFQYRLLDAVDPNRMRATGRPFPPFGFPSPQALAALGDPNAPESNSVAVVDVAEPANAKVETYIRTGTPVGAESCGGSSPSGILAAGDRVFVSNGTDDSVSVIDARTNRVSAEIPIRIPGLEGLRGVLPIGLAYHRQSGRLLVAEAGINAVGVIDVSEKRVIGHIPAAWFPTRVALNGDTVMVASAKGHGVGPDAPAFLNMTAAAMSGYLYQGTLAMFDFPRDAELAAHTAVVMEANGFVARKLAAAPLPDGIHHVVLIVKESRSYDEVLGDLPEGMGEPLLARFGIHGFADGRRQVLSIKDVDVTPNQHEIARQWAFADNFYSDAEGSVDGHHWLTGSYPNAWTQSSLEAAYGDLKDFRAGAAPGRLSFAGNAASVQPEDLNLAGTIWDHLARHGVTFLNFGEGFELAGVAEGPDMGPAGARFATNMPMPEALFPNTVRDYPGFNLQTSDAARAQTFIREMEQRYGKTGSELPSFIFVHLPGDYGAAPNPADGHPYEASYIAENDYALGLIVQYLSGTRWWNSTAVFITEDDAQGGVDHLDAHRTLLLCAGPWFRKGYVSHINAGYPALLKTIFGLLKAPPLNLYDATASDLTDLFARAADRAPFRARNVEERLLPRFEH